MSDPTIIPPTPGPNRRLPALNPLYARSTIAAVLAALSAIAPLLGETGVASVVTEIVSNEDAIQSNTESFLRALDAIIGIGSVVWFWLERRAPNFRLSFKAR